MAKVTLDNQKPKDDDEDDVPVRRPKSQKKNLTDDEIHAGLGVCYIMILHMYYGIFRDHNGLL